MGNYMVSITQFTQITRSLTYYSIWKICFRQFRWHCVVSIEWKCRAVKRYCPNPEIDTERVGSAISSGIRTNCYAAADYWNVRCLQLMPIVEHFAKRLPQMLDYLRASPAQLIRSQWNTADADPCVWWIYSIYYYCGSYNFCCLSMRCNNCDIANYWWIWDVSERLPLLSGRVILDVPRRLLLLLWSFWCCWSTNYLSYFENGRFFSFLHTALCVRCSCACMLVCDVYTVYIHVWYAIRIVASLFLAHMCEHRRFFYTKYLITETDTTNIYYTMCATSKETPNQLCFISICEFRCVNVCVCYMCNVCCALSVCVYVYVCERACKCLIFLVLFILYLYFWHIYLAHVGCCFDFY